MPTYEYKCKFCDYLFEVFHSMSKGSLKKCPSCEKKGLERLIGGGGGIIFKGSGFYETDYKSTRAESGKTGENAPSTKGKPTEKPDKAVKPAVSATDTA